MKRLIAVLSAFALCWFCSQKASADVPRFCSGCNFSGSSLVGADFSGAIYVGSNFAAADLARASFRGAKLVAVNFENADLSGATFDAADCTACNFAGAKLDGATFAGVRMTAANFSGFEALVAEADLRGLLGGCVSCGFHGSHLAGRDLSSLSLIAVDFSGADLRGTRFNGAILCWYDIAGGQRGVKCDSMSAARVDGANFQNVLLCDDPITKRSCVTVDAGTLRRYTGSPLSGATPP
jgi:uncharacterized protein YjbI with pentapeptide repeats